MVTMIMILSLILPAPQIHIYLLNGPSPIYRVLHERLNNRSLTFQEKKWEDDTFFTLNYHFTCSGKFIFCETELTDTIRNENDSVLSIYCLSSIGSIFLRKYELFTQFCSAFPYCAIINFAESMCNLTRIERSSSTTSLQILLTGSMGIYDLFHDSSPDLR